MKKIVCLSILIIFIWLLKPPAKAPIVNIISIMEAKIYYPFNIQDPILRSIAWYESSFNPYAENKRTKARGLLQILPVMIEEVNRILREYDLAEIQYTWKDAWDPIKSMDIWYIVQTYYNPDYNLDEAIRIWFGKGIQYDGKTWRGYFKDVTEYLDDRTP